MKAEKDGSLGEIAATIVAKGKVESDDLANLENYFASNSVIDQNTAELLFQINAVAQVGCDDNSKWQKLFSHSICRFVVFDMNSPGEIADCESEWLLTQISSEGSLSSAEIEMLCEMQRSASSCCELMNSLFKQAKLSEMASSAQKTDRDQ